MRPLVAVQASLRFAELEGEGMAITKAEKQMLDEKVCRHVSTRQAVRKRRIRGDFLGFMATAMLADFSYKTDRK